MEIEEAKLAVAEEAGVVETQNDFYSVFNTTRLLHENAIPVPRNLGERLSKQYDATLAVYKDFHTDWKNAIKTFNEEGSVADFQRTGVAKHNYVRQNVQSLIDFTYLRDPDAEFTSLRDNGDEEKEDGFISALDATLDVVISDNNVHGIGLRKYVQRQIVIAHLTNYGIIKLDHTPKVGSLNDVLELFESLKKKIKDPKDEAELNQLYSLYDRLSEEMQNRKPMGLRLKNISPFMFFVDPACTKDDLSDASFCFEYEYIKESHIKSEYMTFDEDKGKWLYRYDQNKQYEASDEKRPTNAQSAKEKLVDELMPEASEKEAEYNKTGTVLCVWWFDKITKQKYLYIAGEWDTPLWVYEDDLQISQFFPYFLLAFSPSVSNILRLSEASYYIPHQNVINENAKQETFIKRNAFSTFIYNTQMVDNKEVKKLIDEMMKPKSGSIRAVGIKLSQPEAKVENLLSPLIPPSAQIAKLFDNTANVEVIQASSRINNAFTGGEFKTNTTNDAIQAYSTFAETKFSALTDTIEETTARLFWAITEIIVSKFSKDYVTTLIGATKASAFNPLPVQEYNSLYIMKIEAGSTEKANSAQKKQEAVQIIQMLGQFGKAAPMTIISIVSKLLRKVFSPHMVTDKELELLKQEGTAAMQKGVSTQQGQPQ